MPNYITGSVKTHFNPDFLRWEDAPLVWTTPLLVVHTASACSTGISLSSGLWCILKTSPGVGPHVHTNELHINVCSSVSLPQFCSSRALENTTVLPAVVETSGNDSSIAILIPTTHSLSSAFLHMVQF